MTVTGRLGERPGGASEVQVSVEAGLQGRNDAMCSLDTTIVAPRKHPVVLCLSPVGKINSVFVIEVLD